MFNKNDIGYGQSKGKKTKHIFIGVVIGAAIVLLLEIFLVSMGLHAFDPSRDYSINGLLKLLLKAVLSGAAVGLIEETIFRGAVFSLLQKNMNAFWTVFISSFFYSLVHFIEIPLLSGTDVSWYSGLSLIPGSMHELFQINSIDLFLTLFLLGVFFSLFRLKYDNIYMCIGIHAGIVMLVKISKYFSDYVPDQSLYFLVHVGDKQMGYLASVLLIIVTIITLKKLGLKLQLANYAR